ncbi:MAG: thioredoxin fold domain-containing protein [Acidihalobacter sp.]
MRTSSPERRPLRAAGHGLLALALLLGLTLSLSWAPARAGATHELLQRAAAAHWIAQGRGERVVYVIFDPNCPYCHVVYTESQAHLKDFQFRWIPVGVLTPSSPGKAAALLAAKDPVAALRRNEDNFVKARGKLGGIAPLHTVPAAVAGELQDNLSLLESTGMRVVPKLLFLRRNGKVRLIEGALGNADFSAMLKDVAGNN